MRKEVIEKNGEGDRCGVNKKRGTEKEEVHRVVERMVLVRAVIEKEKQLLHRIAS